jgi:hypothetical protein
LLAASVAFAGPPAAGAQTAMTGSQQTETLRHALANADRETRMLATMKNHIPVAEIVTIPVSGVNIGRTQRRGQHAALVDALGKATVADVDRTNGQSEDQSSLAEYLQHLRIDPNKVVAVDIDPRLDPQNPRVVVFYRR